MFSFYSQSSTCGSNSSGPHSPASPGPHPISYEPNSPRLPLTPPPLPPRRPRDSPEVSSPLRGCTDASTPPPLPPRQRETGHLVGSHHHHTHHHSFTGGGPHTPRLYPTHTSQLYQRRHSAVQTQFSLVQHTNGGTV